MDIKTAYNFGLDAGYNGANTKNCHFTIFSKPEFTREWEKGNKVGIELKQKEFKLSLSPCCEKSVSVFLKDDEHLYQCSKCKTNLIITGKGFKKKPKTKI